MIRYPSPPASLVLCNIIDQYICAPPCTPHLCCHQCCLPHHSTHVCSPPKIISPHMNYYPHWPAHCPCLTTRFCFTWIETVVVTPRPLCPSSRATLPPTVFLTPFPPSPSHNPVPILCPLSLKPSVSLPFLPYHCHYWCPSPNSPPQSPNLPHPSPPWHPIPPPLIPIPQLLPSSPPSPRSPHISFQHRSRSSLTPLLARPSSTPPMLH